MAIVYGTQVPRVQKREIISEKPKVYGLNFPIGVGLTPNTFNKGYFAKQSGLNLVKGNLKQLLNTFPGERVMIPDYGLDLRQFLFEPLDEFLFAEMKERITRAIDRFLPEVQITKLSIVSLNEIDYAGIPGLQISLSFTLKNSNDSPSDITVKVGV